MNKDLIYDLQDGFIYNLLKNLIYKKNKGVYILNEDWKQLIILDACRYDIFKRAYEEGKTHKGILEYRISRGYNTMSFLIENFKDYFDLKNIIYITANPFVNRYLSEKIKIISVWKHRWNEKENTVLPEAMFEETIKAYLKYGPSKKYIVHFIQPHYPYIGTNINDHSLDIARRSILKGVNENVIRKHKRKLFHIYETDIYAMAPIHKQIEGYTKNLYLTLPYVNRLTDFFSGTTVITADHGESFGEWVHPLIPVRFYGHGKYVRSKVIVKVPWLIVNDDMKYVNIRTEIHKTLIKSKLKKIKQL